MIINSIDHLVMLDHVESGRWDELVGFLVVELRRLAAAHVDFALLSSNTPHVVIERLQQWAPVPLLSIVDVTRNELLRLGAKRCGLLGTGFTMNADVYPRQLGAAGIQACVPTPDEIKRLHDCYMQELVPGRFRNETRDMVLALMTRMAARHELDTMVLAGTELQLLLGDVSMLPFRVVETADCHIRATVEELLRAPPETGPGGAPPGDPLLAQLDEAVRAPGVMPALSGIAHELGNRLRSTAEADIVWQEVSLALFGRLPEEIKSSWVFALRRNRTTGAERHPNSSQRMTSLVGSANMQTWDASSWTSHLMSGEVDAPLAARWLTIPAGTWHRPVVFDGTWIVVSFHTASAEELLEERPLDDEHPDDENVRRELYHHRRGR